MTTPTVSLLDKVVFFDAEVYRSVTGEPLWCFGFRWWKDGSVRTEIVDSRQAGATDRLKGLLARVEETGRFLVGYNSDQYDLPLMARLIDTNGKADAKAFSDELISHGYWDRRDVQGYRIRPERIWRHVIKPQFTLDIIKRIKAEKEDEGQGEGGTSRLKMVAAILGHENIWDLPFPPDQPISDQDWEVVKEYNLNDLETTEFIFRQYEMVYLALAELSREVGVSLMRFTNAQVTERYFQAAFRSATGNPPDRYVPQSWPSSIDIPISPRIPSISTNDAKDWEDHVRSTVYKSTPLDLRLDKDAPEYLATYRELDFNGFRVSVGFGGVHSVHDAARFVKTDDEFQVIYADVASYYPFLILANRIPMGLMGEVGLDIFQGVVDRRLAMKAKSKDKSLPEEERKAAKIADEALKIIINATYGKLGDKYSVLNAPGSNNGVTISGQLGFCALIERLQQIGVEMLSANTDGLFIRCPKAALDACRQVMKYWQESMRVNLEVELKDAAVIKDSNNWLVVNPDGSLEGKGAYRLKSRATHDKHDPAVINIAILETLRHGTPPEETIRNHQDFSDFLFCAKGNGGSIERNGQREKIKTIRAYAARKSSGWAFLTRNGNESNQLPDSIGLCLKLPETNARPSDINFDWYVGQVREALRVFNLPFRPSELKGAAQDLFLRWGLIPSPARGKITSRGIRIKGEAISFVDWDKTPTLKVYTGPKPGDIDGATPVIVLDIDKPDAWFAFLGEDLAKISELNPLTVTKTTTADVHLAQARGKLIFRIDNSDHRLFTRFRKETESKLLEKAGIEIFNGQGTVAAYGEADGGKQYKIDGTLVTLPEWLEGRLIGIVGKGSSKQSNGGKSRREESVFEEPDWEAIFRRLADDFDERFAGVTFFSEPRKVKQDDGSTDNRFAARMRCPGGRESHDSRKSEHRESELFLDARDGGPVFKCHHKTCRFQAKFDQWRWKPNPEQTPPTLRPLGGYTGLKTASDTISDIGSLIGATKGLKLIRAAVGAGKTHGSAVAAIQAARSDRKTYFVTSTTQLANEFIMKVRDFAPDLYDRIAFGRDDINTKLETEDVASIDEVQFTENDKRLPSSMVSIADDKILIRVICHEALNRRQFSKYMRIGWDLIQKDAVSGGNPLVIVDEFDAFVSNLEQRFQFAYRCQTNTYDTFSRGYKTPHTPDCPAGSYTLSKGGIKCEDCKRFDTTGSLVSDIKFRTIKVDNPSFKIRKSIDDPIEQNESGVTIGLDINDFTLGEEAIVESRVRVRPVLGFKGKSINATTRKALPKLAYRGDFIEAQKEGIENIADTWSHIFGSLVYPTIKSHHPLSKETGQILSRDEVLAINPIGRSNFVDYPLRVCEAPYISGIDGAPLEMIRELADKGADIVLMSATLSETTLDVTRQTIGNLPVVEVETKNKPIAALTVVCVHNNDDIPIRLRNIKPKWLGKLQANQEHDELGKFLFFCPSKKTMHKIIESGWNKLSSGVNFAVASGSGQDFGGRRGTTSHETVLGTIGTQRQPLGRGYDGIEITMIVMDVRSNRLAADIITRLPEEGEKIQEIITRVCAEERRVTCGQNVGRNLRGPEDKRAVTVLLNTTEAEAREIMAEIQADKRAKEINYVTYYGVGESIFSDAEDWLAGANRWTKTEKYDSSNIPKVKARRIERTNTKSKRDEAVVVSLLSLAEEAKANGIKWQDFSRKHNLTRKNKQIEGLRQMVLNIFED